jgi:Ca2+-binding RTX toxin-like protein
MATSVLTTRNTSLIETTTLGMTQTGTIAPDILMGTDGDDFLSGLEGGDRLFGLAGNDTLSGGRDNDQLKGAEGNDKLYGGNGSDRLSGGLGNDLLMGGLSDDVLFGGGGIDTVSLAGTLTNGVSVSLLKGISKGAYNTDQLFGIENIIGSAGDDTLGGSDFGNLIRAAAGADFIYGGRGDDILSGGSGSDTLTGGLNDDKVYGGGSDDILSGGFGTDSLRGGQGADQFVFIAAEGGRATDLVLDFTVGTDKVVVGDVLGADDSTDVTFEVLANGNTLVTVGDADDPLFQTEVTTIGGEMSDTDIIFQ